MFINLYRGSSRSAFKDYNFNYFFGELESVSDEDIAAQFRARIRNEDGWDPNVLGATLEFTLSERVCESYFRDVVGIPATKRDFYLSKLFQFIALSIEATIVDRSQHDVHRFGVLVDVEDKLDEIPDPVLNQVQEFDLWDLQADISPAEGRPRSVAEMEALLNERWEAYLPGAEEDADVEQSDSESTSELSEKRRTLLGSYKTIVGGTAKSVYLDEAVKVDKRDFYRWRNGALEASSKMTRRIEEFIQTAIKEKRRFK